MKFEIKQWNAVATWVWDIKNQDICSICQLAFQSPCPRCKVPGDDCTPVQGNCNHFFHLHCIQRWKQQGSQVCPLDRQRWVQKKW